MLNRLELKEELKAWYQVHCRDLPWRHTRDPYLIWVSEIILQQTRVDQGKPYFLRFTEAFPAVKTLAEAEEGQVLRQWQGLGYYSRARNLHAGARHIMEHYDGVMPNTYESLLSIPGIGAYTASAVASIAYGLPYAVVDGNVVRVLSRIFAESIPFQSAAGKKRFQELATGLMDVADPATSNQALMEFGALHCTPANPSCTDCPVAMRCLAYQTGKVDQFPVKIAKAPKRTRYLHALLMHDGEHILIRKRSEKDIWQGLYEFLSFEAEKNEENVVHDFPGVNYSSGQIKNLGTRRHLLSHQVIECTFYEARVKKLKSSPGILKVRIDQLKDFPFPRLFTSFLESQPLNLI